MNICVLSGKGGTGKTTLSTTLAKIMNANYFDADVEEPNGFIFLKPQDLKQEDVKVEVPVIDKDKCTLCGMCVQNCYFNALAKAGEQILLFDKLCHGCGVCEVSCKFNAISYTKKTIGIIEEGNSINGKCQRGLLNIGEPMAVPVIKALLNKLPNEEYNIIDCPPGTSCNVVTALSYIDRAILVAEPNKFSLNDLKRAVELVRVRKIPFGIVINKKMNNANDIIEEYCMNENISILGEIPYNKDLAVVYSNGELLINENLFKQYVDPIVENIRRDQAWS